MMTNLVNADLKNWCLYVRKKVHPDWIFILKTSRCEFALVLQCSFRIEFRISYSTIFICNIVPTHRVDVFHTMWKILAAGGARGKIHGLDKVIEVHFLQTIECLINNSIMDTLQFKNQNGGLTHGVISTTECCTVLVFASGMQLNSI